MLNALNFESTKIRKMKCKDSTQQTLHGNYISVKEEMVVISKELGKKNKETKTIELIRIELTIMANNIPVNVA